MEKMSISSAITQLNISRTIKGTVCIVHFPDGVSSLLDAFSTQLDKKIPLPWLYQMFQLAIEVSVMSLPDDPATFVDQKTLTDKFVYVGSSKLQIHQSFYTSSYLQLPFEVLSTLDYVGKSSYTKVREMRVRNNSQWFARVCQQEIRIDPVTRKPLELPAPWREKYRPMCTGSPFVMEKLSRPDVCTAEDHYKIQTSDIDEQNHTNWLAYVQICMNVCRKGLDQKLFSRSLIQNSENGLKELQIRYENEALVDEEIVVHAWETSGRDDQLCFELTRGCDQSSAMAITRHTNEYSDAYLDISYYVPPHQYTPAEIEYLISPRPQFPPHEAVNKLFLTKTSSRIFNCFQLDDWFEDILDEAEEEIEIEAIADPIAHRDIVAAFYDAINIEYPQKKKVKEAVAHQALENPPQPPTLLSKMKVVAISEPRIAVSVILG